MNEVLDNAERYMSFVPKAKRKKYDHLNRDKFLGPR